MSQLAYVHIYERDPRYLMEQHPVQQLSIQYFRYNMNWGRLSTGLSTAESTTQIS